MSARLPHGGGYPEYGPVHTTMDRSTHGVARSEREPVIDSKDQHSVAAASVSSSDTNLRPRPPSLSPCLSEKRSSNDCREAEYQDDRRKDRETTVFADLRGAKSKTGKEALRDCFPAGSKPGVKSSSTVGKYDTTKVYIQHTYVYVHTTYISVRTYNIHKCTYIQHIYVYVCTYNIHTCTYIQHTYVYVHTTYIRVRTYNIHTYVYVHTTYIRVRTYNIHTCTYIQHT